YNDFSEHKIEDTISKINQFSELAQKIRVGEVSQDEIMQLLGNTNISFIAGAILGALGTTMFSKILDKNDEEQKS
ncbi:MAG: hypothetical protein GX118_03475, partial [Arcobacter butzleri]|nr:hypothetical protein [Aliarcobacter butzleri]